MKRFLNLVAVASLALTGVSFAEEGASTKKEIILKINLSDLADGQTKTMGDGPGAVTLTRKGDELTVQVSEGKSDADIKIETDGKGGDEHVFVFKTDDKGGKEGDGKSAEAHVFVIKTDDKDGKGGDDKDGKKEIKKEVKVIVNAEGGKVSDEGPFAKQAIYGCSDGATNFFAFSKDQQAPAPECPATHKPMDKLEAHDALLKIFAPDQEK